MNGKKKISLWVNNGSHERINVLKDEYGCTHAEVIDYLLSLETSKIDKGASVVERKIKEWLYLGYPKQITAYALRYADYGYKVDENGNETPIGPINATTCKKILESYATEIEQHNSQF